MKKLRKMKLMELYVVIIFMVLLALSIIFAAVLNMTLISVALIFIDFPIALIAAIFASLSIREEEEEKTAMPTA
jgi:uncharacterized membrane protein